MFGSGEILIILIVVLILFGGKKLPEFAKYLGEGIREFKKACYGIHEEEAEKTIAKSEVFEIEDPHNDNDRTKR